MEIVLRISKSEENGSQARCTFKMQEGSEDKLQAAPSLLSVGPLPLSVRQDSSSPFPSTDYLTLQPSGLGGMQPAQQGNRCLILPLLTTFAYFGLKVSKNASLLSAFRNCNQTPIIQQVKAKLLFSS